MVFCSKCERMGDKMEFLCERNTCIIDSNIIDGVNNNLENYGWTAANNYSEFWGHTLDDGITYRYILLKSRKLL